MTIQPLRASVIIPTYNRREFLLQTLASLSEQSVAPELFEVIVVLDGSTDATEEALAQIRPVHELRWVWQQNGGLAAARNRGAQEARNEVLIFLDDDQIVAEGTIAVHLQIHERSDDVLVQGYYPMPDGWARDGASLLYDRRLRGSLMGILNSGADRWHIWGGHISVRRTTFERVGGFDPVGFRHYGGEDTDFGIRVADLQVPFVFEPRAFSHHLHRCTYGSFQRQAFFEGRSLVQLMRTHRLPIEAFSGAAVADPVNRILEVVWRWPRAGRLLGRAAIASMWVADRTGVAKAQITAARLAHRLFKVGGIIEAKSESAVTVH